jgi:radical SAM-linked protein
MTNRTNPEQPRQRWQLLFARRAPALRMRQPDLVVAFEKAFTDAGLPLSHTNAANPRPRIKLAANPPIGLELRGEIAEAYFDELVPLDRINAAGELLPDGLELLDAREVWHGFPSASSQLRAAEYEVTAIGNDELTTDALRGAVVRLIATRTLPGRRRKGETERRADAGTRDLRPLIEDVEVVAVDERSRRATLRMVLRLDASGAGRPEDVIGALDVPLRTAVAVRTRLLFVDTPPIAR